ncbi:hypothetical protein B9L21_01530 [Geobacillus uzenensis]|uniref:Uncharacterized protein n=1 Tax=Geobacillus uzenensis TaxID=129339 RepID=A0ABX4DJ55_9BACL|nr:hypothetical protein B9L21_01530 [Geobacillus uzenensis]
MNKHTTLPNLMQKLVSDEEIQLIAEAVGYRDSWVENPVRLEHGDDMESLFQTGFDERLGRIP